MVRISKKVINVEDGLHQIVVDTNNETPEIELDLGAGMTNEKYLVWNLAGAIRSIKSNPQEKDIQIQIYKIHREVLQNKGVSEKDLEESDRILKEYTGVVIENETKIQ